MRNLDHSSAPCERQTAPTRCADYSHQGRRCVYKDLNHPDSNHQQDSGNYVDVGRNDVWGGVRDVRNDEHKINDGRIQDETYNTDRNSEDDHKVKSESCLKEKERLCTENIVHDHAVRPEVCFGTKRSNCSDGRGVGYFHEVDNTGLARPAVPHSREYGPTLIDCKNADETGAEKTTTFRHGFSNNSADADISYRLSKRGKTERDLRSIDLSSPGSIDLSSPESEKNRSTSCNTLEKQSEHRLPVHQLCTKLYEASHHSNLQPSSDNCEVNTHNIDYTEEQSVGLSNVQSSILPTNNHNQISHIDSKSVVLSNTVTTERGTVLQGEGGPQRAGIKNLCQISALEGSQPVEIEHNLDSEEFEISFQSKIVDQPRVRVLLDSPFISNPHRSQGISPSSPTHTLPSAQFASSLHNLSNNSNDREVERNLTLLCADSNDGISSSPSTTRNTGNYENNELVLCERRDRRVECLKKILSKLDDDQKDAVKLDGEQPCIVIAGPGSGKTLVLVRRIAYTIIELSLNLRKILALTFSNNAAAEMKERLVSLLGGDASDVSNKNTRDYVPNIKTIHGFCAQVLREFGHHINIAKDFTICKAHDSCDIIRLLLDDEGKSKKTKPQKIIDVISNIKTGRWPKSCVSHDRSMADDYQNLRHSYDTYLREVNMLDFDDLLLETRRLLRDFPDILTNHLHVRFQHIFLDEWQDIDNIQFDIIRMLYECHRQIFAVGDPNQSIYKFRGVEVGNIPRIFETNDNMKQKALRNNYRSSKHIVNVAQSVINQNEDRQKIEMEAKEPPGEKVRRVYAPNAEKEAAFVANEIRNLKKRGQISSYSECAVLYRENKESEALVEAISKKGIHYVVPQTSSFLGREEIVDMLALLRVLDNPADDLSALRIIDVVAGKIGESGIRKIGKTAKREHKTVLKTLEDLISDPQILPMELSEEEMQLLRRCFGIIRDSTIFYEEMRNEPDAQSANVGNLLHQISNETKYGEHVLNKNGVNQTHSRQDKEKNIQKLIEEASSFTKILEFLDHSALEHANTDQRLHKSNAVYLMTMHRSKGLEFEAVFIIGANERSWENCDDNEERRLLYVAITRAKKSLTISWHGGQESTTGFPSLQLCTYLSDLPKESVTDYDLM